jgi:hypothetical protein
MILRLRPASALLAVLAASACSSSRPVQDYEYNDPRYSGAARGTAFGDNGLFSIGGGKNSGQQDQGGALGVNAYLWRGTLDTLSFMPLASADPFGGVIITDWYQPPGGEGERFKATAYILGRQLRADSVKISIFRQVMQGGQWLDAPVSAGTVTEIENKILARARELRVQSAGS